MGGYNVGGAALALEYEAVCNIDDDGSVVEVLDVSRNILVLAIIDTKDATVCVAELVADSTARTPDKSRADVVLTNGD